MARRNALFEIKQIEQLALIAGLSAHHGPSPSLRESSRRNHESPKTASPFSTASVKLGPQPMSTARPLHPRKQTCRDSRSDVAEVPEADIARTHVACLLTRTKPQNVFA